MKKGIQKSLVFLFLGLLLISLLVGFVSAASESELCKAFKWDSPNLCSKLIIWEKGLTIDGTNIDFVGAMTKYLLLFLIIVMIYSALAFANFPENAGLRIIIALILGVLSTFLITTNEIITGLTSYTSLGVTLFTFFPILILGFFTLVVATKASAVGIFIQKIMWLIYSVYLFLKTAVLAYVKYLLSNGKTPADDGIVKFFMGKDINISTIPADSTMLILLLIVSIAVFIIMVISDGPVIAWLGKAKMDSDILAKKEEMERANAYQKLMANQLSKQK